MPGNIWVLPTRERSRKGSAPTWCFWARIRCRTSRTQEKSKAWCWRGVISRGQISIICWRKWKQRLPNQSSRSFGPAKSDVAGRFCLHGGRKPLPGVVAPRADGVQLQVGLPVLPRFGKCAQFFADIGKIVLCIGVVRIKPDSLAEVFPSRVEIPHFFQNASQIKVRQSAAGLQGNCTAEIFRGLFEVSILVVQGSAIEQGVDLCG